MPRVGFERGKQFMSTVIGTIILHKIIIYLLV
jgi:hypothetical protein